MAVSCVFTADQLLAEMDDEVLHIGDDAPGGEASPVTEFVHGKF